ncbi:MAG: AcrB/AcrD/AcrF family protein, partial [Candidatus Buchananbacteria bacterium CG10_big_fil_rev_8_21_14_0_10_42_9]
LIIFILVLQFDSFKQPLVIMLSLPLAMIGVVVGLLLLGLPFGFATFLGIVSLAGIVVNDAIVLIDRINTNINKRHMRLEVAIAEAGQARLQPILLTTITTIIGVTPLAFTDEFWRGLSVAVGFGIAFATILTLFVIPIWYYWLERKRIRKAQAELKNRQPNIIT